MKKYDLVIVSGSQIKQIVKQGEVRYIPAPHTRLKAIAAGIAWQKGIAKNFIITGGYNFGTRYNESKILPKPDFSFKAFAKARKEKSEAEVIRDFMEDNYSVPEEAIMLEEDSSYTEENIRILKILLERTTFSEMKKRAILGLLYHMEKVILVCQKVELEVEPLFAEDLLALEGEEGINKVRQYYKDDYPKTYPLGKKWDTTKIRELLENGKSIGELLNREGG